MKGRYERGETRSLYITYLQNERKVRKGGDREAMQYIVKG
jgi:hypothetical protein